MARLFGTNGIRGIFPEELTLELISEMTMAIGTFLGRGPVLVGHDGRHSSPAIAKLVCSSLNAIGLDCATGGLVPTPALEYATKRLGYSGGIMVTASHNPPQYNGLKPAAADGVEVSRQDELKIEQIYFAKRWRRPRNLGSTRAEPRIVDTYVGGIISQVDRNKIRSKRFKVVLDIGNGAQAAAAPLLCKKLGCQAIIINGIVDGSFSGRGSEPTPSNLQALSRAVKRHRADLGIAFDGDGDRSMFCDDRGTILSGDRSALLLADHILKKNPRSKVVTCLNSSGAIEEIASRTKSKVTRTKVGSVEVSRTMVQQRALIGFEENGGFMYGRHNAVRDGCMTLALALDMLASSGLKLGQQTGLIPQTFTAKDKVACTKQQAARVIAQLKREHRNHDATDGIKLILDKRSWVMVRPSGTEPIARIYAESDSQENLDALLSEYTAKIRALLQRIH